MSRIINPKLDGPVSPTPPQVYEPRLWKARIWMPGGPFWGVPIYFKAPYGQAMNASTVLSRALSRRQISRYQFGAVPLSELRRWTRADRARLKRPEEAFEDIARQYRIDWAA